MYPPAQQFVQSHTNTWLDDGSYQGSTLYSGCLPTPFNTKIRAVKMFAERRGHFQVHELKPRELGEFIQVTLKRRNHHWQIVAKIFDGPGYFYIRSLV